MLYGQSINSTNINWLVLYTRSLLKVAARENSFLLKYKKVLNIVKENKQAIPKMSFMLTGSYVLLLLLFPSLQEPMQKYGSGFGSTQVSAPQHLLRRMVEQKQYGYSCFLLANCFAVKQILLQRSRGSTAAAAAGQQRQEQPGQL